MFGSPLLTLCTSTSLTKTNTALNDQPCNSRFLREVEHVRPEAADPLGVGLAEIEGVADAAVLRFQALHQAARQVIDGDVRLDEHEPHVDERQHAAVALGQWIETQPEQLRTGRAAGLRLRIAQFGIEVVDEGDWTSARSLGSRLPQEETKTVDAQSSE